MCLCYLGLYGDSSCILTVSTVPYTTPCVYYQSWVSPRLGIAIDVRNLEGKVSIIDCRIRPKKFQTKR